MKKLFIVLSLVFTHYAFANITPGEQVNANSNTNKVGYDIASQTTDKDRKTCLDLDGCYAKCIKNSAPAGSKTPCSSVTYDLVKVCKQSCVEKKRYVTLETKKGAYNEGQSLLQGFDGTCSTIENCMRYYHDQVGWPYQCAHIYCSYIDAEDGRARVVGGTIPDATNELFVDQDARKKGDDLPPEFSQIMNEQ